MSPQASFISALCLRRRSQSDPQEGFPAEAGKERIRPRRRLYCQRRLSGSDVCKAGALELWGPETLMGAKSQTGFPRFFSTVTGPWPCHDADDTIAGVAEPVGSR